MAIIELQLSPIQNSYIVITRDIKCSTLNDLFCLNLNNHRPTIKNIDNNKIKLFTFSNILDKFPSLDVSNLKINNTKNNIATEFLEHVSMEQFGNNRFKQNILNWEDVVTYIDVSCSEKADDDITKLKETASITSTCNDKTNVTCRKITEKLIELCPSRFKVNNKITSLPFKRGDKIKYNYTIIYGQIKRIYTIQLNIV